jgi:hypothetical protein
LLCYYVRTRREVSKNISEDGTGKCVFATDSVEYLGHIVIKEGVKPDPGKVQAIREHPTPRTVRDVHAFIGLAGYYRHHVPNFAKFAKLLTNLTRKDVPFEWGPEQETAFRKLKVSNQEPLLIYPNFSHPFIVACDVLFYYKFGMGKSVQWLIAAVS